MPLKSFPLLVLIASVVACALPGGPTPPPIEAVQTSVAATLTAAVPPTVPVPTDTPIPTVPVTLTPAPPSAACFFAVADFSTVLCVNGPDQFEIANTSALGTISDVAISPDGGLVAYTVALIDGTAELWVVNADGTNARKLVSKEQLPATQPDSVSWPRAIQWQAGTHTIFFDTGWTPTAGIGGPGEYMNSDLWWVNADTGELTQMLSAGTGGLFSVSPDGAWVAVSQPESIGLISADGSTVRSGVLTFPSIITYSEYAYKPQVTWSADGAFFTVPIPSADPMAADTSATVWQVRTDGSAQQLLTVPGNFVFGGAMKPSPDGQWVAYAVGASDGSGTFTLNVAKTDGSGAGGSEALGSGNVQMFGWSPDSLYFAYSFADQGLFAGTLNVNPQPLGEGVQNVKEVVWSDPTAVVFSGALNDHWGLRTAQVGGRLSDLAGPFSNTMVFDVRR